MAGRLAEPARTGCRGEGDSVLGPLLSPGLRCGLRCRLLRRGLGTLSRRGHDILLRGGRDTGQFLAADPDGGDRDDQGDQPDHRGNKERTEKPTVRA